MVRERAAPASLKRRNCVQPDLLCAGRRVVRAADVAAPGTEAVGTNAIPALRDRGGCTLANHGVLAVGKDLAQAYLRAEYIEDVAKVYTFSKVLGTPVELASL